MSSTYVSNELAAQDPSVAPSPNSTPKAVLPADGDPLAASSVAQMVKAQADNIAYLKKCARFFTRIAALTTASGFSAVIQTGVGTGTVTPNGGAFPWASDTTSGLRFVIKITVAGVVGTSKYQYSTDGGVTYNGADIFTAASITQASVTMALANTFDLGDTYSFSQIDTPRIQLTDHAGNLRAVIGDHLGFPILGTVRGGQAWDKIFTKAATGVITEDREWAVATNTAGTMQIDVGATTLLTSTLPRHMAITGGLNAEYLFIVRQMPLIHADWTFAAIVLQWDAWLTAIDANDITVFMGLGDATTPLSAANTRKAGFARTSGVGNTWQLRTANNAAETDVNTGNAPVANTRQRFRLEYHGSGGPYATKLVRGFVNGVLCGVGTATLPTANPLFPYFGYLRTAAGAAALKVGNVEWGYTEQLANWAV